jgi:hypothetical protein
LTKLNKIGNDLTTYIRGERLYPARLGWIHLEHFIKWSFAESRGGGSSRTNRIEIISSPDWVTLHRRQKR